MNAPKTIPPIKLKNSAKSIITRNQTLNLIVDELKKIPNYNSLKFNIEITEFACNIIENSINNNSKKKIDKKVLLIEAMTLVFGLGETDKLIIAQHVDYLFNNNKIKKTPLLFMLNNILQLIPMILKKV